jgi:hypothetical protein
MRTHAQVGREVNITQGNMQSLHYRYVCSTS